MTFKVYFNVTDLGAYGAIPGLKDAMQSELIRVYNIYADKTNSGITEQLNGEFDWHDMMHEQDNPYDFDFNIRRHNWIQAKSLRLGVSECLAIINQRIKKIEEEEKDS